jgi:putative ABC transport system substrate-binding protein
MIGRAMLAIALVLSLVAALPAAEAQPAPVRIGILPLGSPSNAYDRSLVEAFRQGLREVGLIEPRHVVLDVAWITSEPDHTRAVTELMQRGARLLVPCGTSASLAAKRQATTLPILFISVGNPVGIGLVESLARPGGHATGFSDVLADLGGKLLQFSRELGVPQATFHYLWHPDGRMGPTGFRRRSGRPSRPA